MKKPISFSIEDFCQKARAAGQNLGQVETEVKNRALLMMADALLACQAQIIKENQKDLNQAKEKGLKKSLIDRLELTPSRIQAMAQGLREIAELDDPVGQKLKVWSRPNGLKLQKIRIPLGVIAIIYESRPNVTVDAAGLCLKSGNAVILRGGSEAFHSNQVLAEILSQTLMKAGLPAEAIQILPTRERQTVGQLLKMDEWIDLVIPRGGESLIRYVVKEATMPVLKHYKGVCHLYLDETADLEKARKITLNAKVDRPGVCNAIETLLVHRTLKENFLGSLIEALQKEGVEVRGNEEIQEMNQAVKPVKSEDWGEEFLDLILPIKLVDSTEEAIEHIQTHGSNHTEGIVTENLEQADKFTRHIFSSVICINASTRFADGGQMGMGAEMGISTTRLHAYGPMGVEDLTIGRYVIIGEGQVRET